MNSTITFTLELRPAESELDKGMAYLKLSNDINDMQYGMMLHTKDPSAILHSYCARLGDVMFAPVINAYMEQLREDIYIDNVFKNL